MGKKVYHIVDPETGEVVGKKRVGWFTESYYKASSGGKTFLGLLMAGIICMPLSFILLFFAAFSSGEHALFWGVAASIAAVLCIVFLLIAGSITTDEHKEKKMDNGNTSESNERIQAKQLAKILFFAGLFFMFLGVAFSLALFLVPDKYATRVTTPALIFYALFFIDLPIYNRLIVKVKKGRTTQEAEADKQSAGKAGGKAHG